MTIPIEEKMLVRPKIIPKFLVPKYSLRIGVLTGIVPAIPRPKVIANRSTNPKELPSISQKRNIPTLIKPMEKAITCLFWKMSDNNPKGMRAARLDRGTSMATIPAVDLSIPRLVKYGIMWTVAAFIAAI